MISAAEFQKMQPHTLLINTARGGIVDEAALVHAIEAEQIAGAGVDVLVTEFPLDSSPLLSIAHRANVIVKPHIAWASEQAIDVLAEKLIQNIEAYAAGSEC